MSTTTVPAARPAPTSPSSTSRTSAPVGNIVMTASRPSNASAPGPSSAARPA